jgi:translation initiation factor IF-3
VAKAKPLPKKPKIKTIELNWAIDANDLGHRLAKMKEFLEKGSKVEVILAPKRRGRKATPEESRAVVDRIMAAVGEVDGAKEAKMMAGNLGAQCTIFLEGKA